MVADFWIALEEAERTRMLCVVGMKELTHSLKRAEQQLGVSRDDENLAPNESAALQAAWERAEMAEGEISNEHPHLNAQTLVSMNSALDALVEEWVPAMRGSRVEWLIEEAIREADEKHPEAVQWITPELREHFVKVSRASAAEQLPPLERLSGSGVERYEKRLRQEGLGAPDGRSIPADMDRALAELGALRDVLIHRAGRVDGHALRQAPSLRYKDGDLVRINREEYRMYSAAVRCYAAEINFRAIRNRPEVTDEKDGPDLANWREFGVIGA
jgi:hypothetical protein